MAASLVRRTLTVFFLSLFALVLGSAVGGTQETTVGDFDVFDANNDNALTEQEFNEGVFENIDANNSGAIEEEELNAFAETEPWFDAIGADFANWDADNNDELIQEELNQGVENVELFGEWDADNDNVLDEREFQAGMEKPRGGDGRDGATTGTTTMRMAEETTAVGTLAPSGGSNILLPAAALLMGAGVLSYAVLRRTTS